MSTPFVATIQETIAQEQRRCDVLRTTFIHPSMHAEIALAERHLKDA